MNNPSHTASPLIGIDCRMLNNSGIGTCIKGILPHLIPAHATWRFQLFGRPAELATFPFSSLPNVTITPFEAPIYSPREQLDWLRRPAPRPDILWVPHMNIPLLWPGKLLVTVHDVIFLALAEQFGPLKTAYARLFYGRIKNRADAIAFDTNFTAAEFARLVGPPKNPTQVIYNGVDEKWFQPTTSGSLPPSLAGTPYIVCVGNLKPNKNLRRLIEAFFLMQDRVPHKLVIVGKREGFLTADNEAETTAASHPRIIFTGFVSDSDLRAIVAHADALIHPSLYEGFGLTPLEAMAAGCPAIISNAGSLPETSGNAAIYFSPTDVSKMADTIASVLKNPALRAELKAKGTAHVQQFKWQTTASKITGAMEALLARA